MGGGKNFPIIAVGHRRVEGDDAMQIVSALAEGLGPEFLTPMERRVMQGHFYKDGTPAVVMYGAPWCGYCKQMREYFKSNKIEFTELDAETEAKTHYAALKGGGYPLIYVGYRRIEGANIRLFEQTLKELKI
ncbi:MAG: glutaredoxin domain-containing protein [Gammaproteobacteria bacterium]